MARYPTFEEYQKRGNFAAGIKRCDDLLKRTPTDVQLLTVKLQLSCAANQDAEPILQQLLAIQPPIADLREIVAIEEAIVESSDDVYPRPRTIGPTASKIWDNAFKASKSTNYKLDLQSLRFSRAIIDDRLVDAQQALIQLKVLQPKNRVFYMAHVAITQLLSESKEDLQSRLALSLARKAVAEKFDNVQSLDCRVPGQIFALQNSKQDIDTIGNRSFKESKQVYQALRKDMAVEYNGIEAPPQVMPEPRDLSLTDWARSEIEHLKQQFSSLIESSAPSASVQAFTENSIRLFRTMMTQLSESKGREIAEPCFLSISAMVRLFELSGHPHHLLLATFLAEKLLEQDTHIHEARLILVYLYMRLGLGSLAMQFFNSLKVKEIQHEASVLNNGQTGMILDIHELRQTLRTSVMRRIFVLENRRINRLLECSAEHDEFRISPRITANWLEVTDSRDLEETFDYGYNIERVLHGFRGTIPGQRWILYSLTAESAWCIASGIQAPVIDPENIVKELADVALTIEDLHVDGEPSHSGLSDAECLAGDLALQTLRMLLQLKTESDVLLAAVEMVHKAVHRLNVSTLVATEQHLCERLQDSYVCFDALRTVQKAAGYAQDRAPDCREQMQHLREVARRECMSVQKYAREQSLRTKPANVRSVLSRGESILMALRLAKESDLDPFCERVASSACDGWKGLASIAPL